MPPLLMSCDIGNGKSMIQKSDPTTTNITYREYENIENMKRAPEASVLSEQCIVYTCIVYSVHCTVYTCIVYSV